VQHEQHVGCPQPGEGPYFLGEHIDTEQDFRMAGEKLLPAQSLALGRWRYPVAAQDVGDAALGARDAKLEQLPPESGREATLPSPPP
jgi:hypothetical protein